MLPRLSLPAPCLTFTLFYWGVGLTCLPGAAGRDGGAAPDLRSAGCVPLGDPTAISLCFFQVWGQILTAIACPLPSLPPPSPPFPLPPTPVGR